MLALKEALHTANCVIIDVRDTQDITARGASVVGHVNIPWNEFGVYESRFQRFNFIVPSKDTPIVLYADKQTADYPGLFKTALEERCGYTNVHSCDSSTEVLAVNGGLEISATSNLLPIFADHNEIRALRAMGAVLIDSRDADEIEKEKDSFKDHVNIPWSTFQNYSARLNEFGGELLGTDGRGKDTPIMVICMRGRRAMFFKDALEKKCGFTNVFNCQNPGRVHEALPEVEQTNVPNKVISEHLSVAEISALGRGVCIVDAREPEEIARGKDAIDGHINIPWSSFSQFLSRLERFDDVICSKQRAVLVHCVNGRRATSCKEALHRHCGFTKVFSCSSSTEIKSAFPDLALTDVVAQLSPYAAPYELRALFESGAIIVDVREPEEIASVGAFAGHLNIPWSSVDAYLHRLKQFELLGEKTHPIIIHCMNGRRAGLFKDVLEKQCGYTNVFNGEHPGRVASSAPELATCRQSNAMSVFASPTDIKSYFSNKINPPFVIDCREADEITAGKDAISVHTNIPWSTFHSQGAALFKEASRRSEGPELNRNTHIVVYCSKGWRSGHMLRFLEHCGFTNVINCQHSGLIFEAVPELFATKTGIPNAWHYN